MELLREKVRAKTSLISLPGSKVTKQETDCSRTDILAKQGGVTHSWPASVKSQGQTVTVDRPHSQPRAIVISYTLMPVDTDPHD